MESSAPSSPRMRSPLSQHMRERGNLLPRDGSASNAATKPPRSVLYKRRVCDLDQYRKDFKAHKYENLTREEKRELFGSTIVPIHVPLAPGETEEMYEERFNRWLRKQNLVLAELEASSDDHLERFYRIKFANLNSQGDEAFVSQSRKRSRSTSPPARASRPRREHDDAASESSGHSRGSRSRDRSSERKREKLEPLSKPRAPRRCTLELPGGGASLTELVEAYISCGCRPCLVSGMDRMVNKLAECVEPSQAEKTQDRHIDLTDDCESVNRRSTRETATAITRLVQSAASIAEVQEEAELNLTGNEYTEVVEDVVENELVLEYDTVNARVEQGTSPSDVSESVSGNRIATLAMAIVYLWRNDPTGLEQIISDVGATDDEAQQRTIHRRCMQLSQAIVHKKASIVKLKQRLDATFEATGFEHERDQIHVLTRLGKDLAITEAALQAARQQRKNEFAAIARVSQPLRGMVRSLLSP